MKITKALAMRTLVFCFFVLKAGQCYAQRPNLPYAPQYLGYSMGLIGKPNADQLMPGVFVADVYPGGPAASARIEAGDVISVANGMKVESVFGLETAMARGGSTVVYFAGGQRSQRKVVKVDTQPLYKVLSNGIVESRDEFSTSVWYKLDRDNEAPVQLKILLIENAKPSLYLYASCVADDWVVMETLTISYTNDPMPGNKRKVIDIPLEDVSRSTLSGGRVRETSLLAISKNTAALLTSRDTTIRFFGKGIRDHKLTDNNRLRILQMLQFLDMLTESKITNETNLHLTRPK